MKAAAWILLAAASARAAALPDAQLLDSVLRTHVRDDGFVRYAALKAGLEPLDRYVKQLAQVSPDSAPQLFPSREAKLAYWINAYNALVLWAMAREYPEKKSRLVSPLSRAWFFFRNKFRVGGVERTLSDIENNSIRKPFGEPRIHFAIVCASLGCPRLANRVFLPETLDRQLEGRAQLFFSESRNLRVDLAARRIEVSSILKWFAGDFGADTNAVLRFVARYRPAEAAALSQPGWKVSYLDYDWHLNDAP